MKTPDGFEDFWKVYPRRVAKLAAIKAYARALRYATPAVINEGAARYAQVRAGQDPQFTAHPSTWLNAGRWSDEISTTQPPTVRAAHLQPVGSQVYIEAETPEWFAWQKVKRTPVDKRGGWWFPSQWPNGVH